MEYPDRSLDGLRNNIRIARYDVDPVAVADAIVRRRWTLAVASPGTGRVPPAAGRRGRTSVTCIARHGPGRAVRSLAA